jgi:hypothetical protein
MKKVYKINPNFPDLLGRLGYSLRGFCREFNVPHNTIHSALNPKDYPDRIGSVQPRTAWRIARAYAQAAKIDEQAAYAATIVEETADCAA